MIHHKFSLLCLSIIITLLSCSRESKKTVSFYHWKLKAENSTSAELLQQIDPHHIYLHIMDIHHDPDSRSAFPVAHLNMQADDPILSRSIIPVIFIHNTVMAQADSPAIRDLAARVISSYDHFISHHGIQNVTGELQIDCDWLKSHKDKYFYFLQSLKEQRPEMVLSVTLRLYPYKYREAMGIPPVDYVTLMCYNMEDIRKAETKQSILDPDVLAQYLTVRDYPLRVKVALPVFGWWAWFSKDNYKNIFYFTDDFKHNTFLKKESEFRYMLLKDTSVNGRYLRKGDILRNEFPTPEDIDRSIQILEAGLDFEDIIYYHWDPLLIQQYENIFIQ